MLRNATRGAVIRIGVKRGWPVSYFHKNHFVAPEWSLTKLQLIMTEHIYFTAVKLESFLEWRAVLCLA